MYIIGRVYNNVQGCTSKGVALVVTVASKHIGERRYARKPAVEVITTVCKTGSFEPNLNCAHFARGYNSFLPRQQTALHLLTRMILDVCALPGDYTQVMAFNAVGLCIFNRRATKTSELAQCSTS